MCVSADDKKALDDHFSAIYMQLRRVAQAMLAHRANATLTPTAVVHEAYARLAEGRKIPDVTELSFKRITAHVMRQVLCDAARRRYAEKRGGNDAVRVALDDQLENPNLSVEQILLVDDLLDRLHAASPRRASVVELVFFGGLTMPEVAAALGVSGSTAERDWRFARAWIATEARRTVTKAGKSVAAKSPGSF